MDKKKKSLGKKILHFIGKSLLVLALLFTTLVLVIRSPWGQDKIIHQVTKYVSKQTATKFSIDKFFLTFDGNLNIQGLYLEDQAQKTLLSFDELELSIPLMTIFKQQQIDLKYIHINGLESTIYRNKNQDFNYQFLIYAFASEEEDKEESESELEFLLGKIQLTNTNLSYLDEEEGLDAEIYLGDFLVRIDVFDLSNLNFEIDEIFLGNSDLQLKQYAVEKVAEVSGDEKTIDQSLPNLKINNFQLSKLNTEIQFFDDDYSAFISNFNWNLIELNLDQKKVSWKDLILNDAVVNMNVSSPKDNEKEKTNEEVSFEWPDWEIAFDQLLIKNQKFTQTTKGEGLSKKAFDAGNFQLDQLYFELAKVSYVPTDKNLKAQLKQFQFEEFTGLSLKNSRLQLQVSDQGIQLEQLQINALENELRGNLAIQFSQLSDFINQPENFSFFDLNLAGYFQLSELEKLIPNFQKNDALVKLARHPIQSKIEMKGSSENLEIKPSFVLWNKTKINLAGGIQHALKDIQSFQLNTYQIQTNKQDILVWLDEEYVDNLTLPNAINLQGSLKNKANLWTTKSKLKTDLGNLALAGNVNLGEEIDFNFSTQIEELALEKILQNDNLSPLSVHFESKGKYKDVAHIDFDFSLDIEQFELNNYSIAGLQVKSKLQDSKGDFSLTFEDENLDFVLNSTVELADNFYVFQPELVVNGIDFYNLGWLNEDIKAKFTVQSEFRGIPEEFDFRLSIPEFVSMYKNTSYQLNGLDLEAQIGPKHTNLKTKSKFLNTQLKANKHPSDLVEASWNYIQKYITDFTPEEEEIDASKIDLEWDMQLVNVPLLSEVYLADLKEMDTLKLSLDFKEEKNEIRANVSLPHLIYKDIELNKLAINVNANPTKADFSFGFDQLESGGFQIAKTLFSGQYEDEFWKLTLEAFQGDDPFFYIRSFIEKEEEYWVYSLDDDELILNSQNWEAHPKNYIQFGNQSLSFSNFEIERKQQKLAIRNDLSVEDEHFGLLFNNFKLGTLTSYFHPDALFAKGEINGDLIVVKPFEQIGFLADLSIDDLYIKEKEIGRFQLHASADGSNTYATEMELLGEQIELFAQGKYFYENEQPTLDVGAQLKRLSLSLVEFYIPEIIEESQGEISSDFKLKGPTNELTYRGDIRMKDLGFKAKAVNTKFYFGDEKVSFNQDEIEFKKFTIADAQKNKFITTGKIYIDPLSNPKFDLNFKAEKFQLLDAERDESTAYYGKVNFDLNAQLTGNLNIPKLELDFKLNKSTDFTFVIPESQADVVDREGVVMFVNKSNPDDILTRTTEHEFNQLIKGFDIEAKIKISPRAKITVIFNQRTGDQIQLQGEGDLLAQVEPNGNIDLSGTYEVNEGFFEINLYNLVTRKFSLAQGSKVSWYGDPYNADLDIRAVYKLDTSPSALMASQIASEASSVQNRYRRQLPFWVYLDVEGSLSSPYLSFGLDMPEEQRSAINGTVYARINQLNQQEDELNKQVFSLLVLNRFYPESGSDGSQGGAAALARNNLNQALADQLNTFSNKLTGNTGIELNFDINSYTDFETGVGQERTDVDVSAQKKLFNDRLVVEAGSQVNVQGDQRPGESNVALGNVSVEYLITEDGRWKARGFRKSEYENVIDGQVFVSGIALIFTREFNEFEELWKSLFATSKKLEELEKEELEEAEEMEQDQEKNNENEDPKSTPQARIENEE
ncbi:MAG: translocation/assembly module TamB [Flavobacteriaceae bacterium]|nr:translocation/assembly module TamB [Flavobacteriaceae bacterium]